MIFYLFCSPAVLCTVCKLVISNQQKFEKHCKKITHGALMKSREAEGVSLTEWGLLVKSGKPHTVMYHCAPCYFATMNVQEFEIHNDTGDHKTQMHRMADLKVSKPSGPETGDHKVPKPSGPDQQPQEGAVETEVNFGIVSLNSVGSITRRVTFTNPSAKLRRTLTALYPGSSLSSNSPFNILISLPVDIAPLKAITFDVKFNMRNLPPGYYFDRAGFKFSRPDRTLEITFKATLGDRDLLWQLRPTEQYTGPKGKVRPVCSQIFLGKRPPMKRIDYKINLGQHPIPNHLEAILGIPIKKLRTMPPFNTLRLTANTYQHFFSTLLHAEEAQMNLDIQFYDLEDVVLEKDFNGFVLHVPGLLEKRPSVLYGDSVLLLKSGSNFGWEGYVVGIRESNVVLQFGREFNSKWLQGSMWDVQFSFSRIPLQRMHDAVQRVSKGQWRQTLFPARPHDERKEENQTEVEKIEQKLNIKDRKIEKNEKQRRAVALAVSGMHGTVPLLIFGPPGTGKTSTIVECIYQLLRHPTQVNKPVRILATAPSNPSADLILERLSKYFDQTEMFRLNAPSRRPVVNNGPLKKYCSVDEEEGLYSIPPVENLESFKVIVSTCGAAGILYGIGGADLKFTHVVVDEAGHALEPETMLAFQNLSDTETGRVILSGDPLQLGPIVRSPVAKNFRFGMSLLERLVTSAANVPNNRGCYSVAEGTEFSDIYGVQLLNNYRSHPSILEIPNQLFYHSRLVPEADHHLTYSLAEHPILPAKGFPVLFQQMDGKDEREGDSPSWFNPLEVTAVIELVKNFLEERGKFKAVAKDIGIITPYRKQVAKIKTALAKLSGTKDITVGTTEFFQGSERRIIIVSTVRSRQDMIEFDIKSGLGFIGDAKRFNVAMTRAMAILCVVGDARVLKIEPYWRRWLDFVIQNNGWKGPKVTMVDETPNGGGWHRDGGDNFYDSDEEDVGKIVNIRNEVAVHNAELEWQNFE